MTKVRGNVKHVKELLVIGAKEARVGNVVGDITKTFSQVHVCSHMCLFLIRWCPQPSYHSLCF
jgi:hypothetical protein